VDDYPRFLLINCDGNTTMKDIVIIGASGFGSEVAWLIERINNVNKTWNILGFVDDNLGICGKDINGYKVLGSVDSIKEYQDVYYVVAIGNALIREKVVNRVLSINPKSKFATLIDPSVISSKTNTFGEGSIICANTIITVNVDIGKHTIINLSCTVGHSAKIGSFVTLYPTVNVSGNVVIEDECEIGTGAQVIQGIKISNYSTIGAGAVVINDISSNCVAVGCPAKPIKYTNGK